MQHHVDRIKTFWYTEDDFETNNSPKKYSVSPNLSDVSPCIYRRCKRLRLVDACQSVSPSYDSNRNLVDLTDNNEENKKHVLQQEDENTKKNSPKYEINALEKKICMKNDTSTLIKYIQTCFELKSSLKKVFCFNEESKDLLHHVTDCMNHACTRVTKMSRSALMQVTKEVEAFNKHTDCQLKEYQLIGVLWLLTLQQEQQNGILADDMGLGKTAQTLTFLNLAYHSRKVLKYASVILCPPSLLSNWMSELQLWAPQLRCVKYYGTFKDRREALKLYEASCESENQIHIILASYHTVSNRWDRSMLYKMYKFEYLIVDEAHILKNDASRIHQHLKKYVTCKRRLLLTGSPIQNEIAELQSLLSLILCPKFHSQLSEIIQKNADCNIYQDILRQALSHNSIPSLSVPYENCVELNSNTNQSVSAISFLQTILSPFILRRLKCQVVTDLPAKMYFIEMCVLEGEQKEMYFRELSKATSDIGKELLELFSVHDNDKNALDISNDSSSDTCIKNIIFRLRRICNHPLLYKGYYSSDQRKEFVMFHLEMLKKNGQKRSLAQIEDMIESFSDYNLYEIASEYDSLAHLKIDTAFLLASTKIRKMLCLVDEVIQNKKKVLIFSYFTQFLDIIEETIRVHRPQYSYLSFHGRIDGSTPVLQRQGFVDEFSTNDQVKIFLLSTKSSGVGLNLTAASCVILMDQDWNPHNDRQAENRVHRFGQKNVVSIYRLCCKDTLECKILQISNRKLSLDRAFGGTQESLNV